METNYNNIEAPPGILIPYNARLGISDRMKDIVLIVSAIHLIIQFILYLWHYANIIYLKILIIMIGAPIIIIILIKPFYEIMYATKIMNIHSSDTISNPAMVNVIIDNFETEKDKQTIYQKFINSSWDKNAINIFNKIVMTFYETTGKIFTKLESIENEIASNNSGIREANRSILNLEIEMNKNFKKIDSRFEQMDKRFEQMDKRFDKLEQMIIDMQK